MSETPEILQTPQQQADDRFVHALLLHIHEDEMARRQRVARVMECISDGEPRHATFRQPERNHLRLPGWRKSGVLAAAASILLGLAILFFMSTPTPVMASLSDILTALSRPGDRTFRIHVEPPSQDSNTSRPGLDQATLYLRNGNEYVLTRINPRGGEVFDGYDGNQSWRVRRGEMVEEKQGLGAGGIPMSQTMLEVPFADLQNTLSQLNDGYVVDRFDRAQLPGVQSSFAHVLAHRKSQAVKGPQTIEIWADTKTGVPQRIVFDKAKFQGSSDPRRLTFDLVSDSPLSANWFTPSAHEAQN